MNQRTRKRRLLVRYIPNRKTKDSTIRRRYTAAELNIQSDLSAPMPTDLSVWENMRPVGREMI